MPLATLTTTPGPEPEDTLSFTSAIFGALGSTLQQQNNPKTLLLALVFAAFAKALPSLGQSFGDPAKKNDRPEDLILFFAALLAALGAGIQSNFSFSTPLSQEILVFGLVIGLGGKAALSLRGNRKSLEDWIPFVAAVASALAVLPWGTEYATVGIFFGFLGKQLVASPPAPSPQPTGPIQRPPS